MDVDQHRKQEIEFLSALDLVPRSIKCELWKRKRNIKSQFGNWWERLHSQNFSMIQSYTQEEAKDDDKVDDDSILPASESFPEKVEVYLEISKLQSEISSQSETQQQLIEALNALKTKISTLSGHKQIITNEGSKLLVSMQSFYEWASL